MSKTDEFGKEDVFGYNGISANEKVQSLPEAGDDNLVIYTMDHKVPAMTSFSVSATEEPTTRTDSGMIAINEHAIEDDVTECEHDRASVEGEYEQETSFSDAADFMHGTSTQSDSMKEQDKEPTSKIFEVQLESLEEATTFQPHTSLHSGDLVSDSLTSHLPGCDSGATGQQSSKHHHATHRESLLGKLSEEVQQSLFTAVGEP